MFPYFRLYLLCGGGINGFCSATKYSPFMIYLHLQNQLMSNSHKYYMCEGEGYCELLINFADCLCIAHVFWYIHSRNEREKERRADSVNPLSINHNQAHKLVV